jgi:hypothetical protein
MEIAVFRRILSFVVAVAATSCLALASAPPIDSAAPAPFVQSLA